MSVEPEETEVVICEACGATNAAHNQICTRCEAPLVAAPVEPERTANAAPHLELTEQEQIRGCSSYLWVAMTIVGLAIILLVPRPTQRHVAIAAARQREHWACWRVQSPARPVLRRR